MSGGCGDETGEIDTRATRLPDKCEDQILDPQHPLNHQVDVFTCNFLLLGRQTCGIPQSKLVS